MLCLLIFWSCFMSSSQTNLQKAGRFKTLQDLKARQNSKKKKKERSSTFTTTAVTPLSTQKNVSDLLAYCSENLRITSRDFSDGSPAEISNCKNQHLNCYITEPCGSCPQTIHFSNLFNYRTQSMRFLNPDIYRPKMLATAFFLKQTKRFDTELQQTLFDSLSRSPKSVLLAH